MRAKRLVVLMVLGGSLSAGGAMQHSSAPTALSPLDDMTLEPKRNTLDDAPMHGSLDAERRRSANIDRQRTLTREAAQLLQVAAELQLKAQESDSAVSREEMVRQVEMIEKLAHNVKERMKGGR